MCTSIGIILLEIAGSHTRQNIFGQYYKTFYWCNFIVPCMSMVKHSALCLYVKKAVVAYPSGTALVLYG